jgi:2-phosphosulfolactate phosphatase
MHKTVVIDYLPESVPLYRADWTIVAVDVIRATTTAVTAAATGRRCFPLPTIEAAIEFAQEFDDPLLAGETGGTMPFAFEMDNSPAQLMRRTDIHRPFILVSSSGTKVIAAATGCKSLYLACFRNCSALAEYLMHRYPRIAIIGAGCRGEFREEDQICCAWIARDLIRAGYLPANAETEAIVSRWQDAPAEACLCSRSVDFLRRTDQLRDLNFVLTHINDLNAVFTVENGEVKMISIEQTAWSPASGPAPVSEGLPAD